MKINLYNYDGDALAKAEDLLFEYHNEDTGLEYGDIVDFIINESNKEGITREEAIMVVEELEENSEYY